MYARVVAAISGVVFAAVAVMAAIVTDLHDRTFPSALNVAARASLDFSRTGWTDAEALSRLQRFTADQAIDVYKVAPDLRGKQDREVLISFRLRQGVAHEISRFGAQAASRLEGPSALAHSFASGQYLISGDEQAVSGFRSWVESHRVVVGNWSEDSFADTVAIVWRQSDFAVCVAATIAVMVAIVLFWNAVRARGRALRVLAGAAPMRVQGEEFRLLALAILSGALSCSTIAVLAVGLTQGWLFAPFYAACTGAFIGLILAVTAGFALLVSLTSWPDARMLARRLPAVAPLRKVAGIVKAVTFVMVIVSVGPAVSAYIDSSAVARQQATWKTLADQVGVTFPASGGDDQFTASAAGFHRVVVDAQKTDAVSLSYVIGSDPSSGVDLGAETNLALVSQHWLDLVHASRGANGGEGQTSGLTPVGRESLDPSVRAYLDASLPVWLRHDDGPEQNLRKFGLYRWSGPAELPAIRGGDAGDLDFLDTALVMVALDPAESFSDDFLISAASTRNVVFAGVGPTESLLARYGLGDRLSVKLVAEDGVLRAQYTDYFAWLRALTVVAMVVALAVATIIGAVISALMNARKDFAMRVSGASWWTTLRRRLAMEWMGGTLLAGGVIVATNARQAALVLSVALAALFLLPVAHVAAARWSFDRVVARNL